MKNFALGGIGPSSVTPQSEKTIRPQDARATITDFRKQLFNTVEELDGLKISGHAAKRLESRDVELTPERAQRLLNAVETAREKGARESLVLLDELAFVVSVRNKTVITACDTKSLRENVFTKIDSAIIG